MLAPLLAFSSVFTVITYFLMGDQYTIYFLCNTLMSVTRWGGQDAPRMTSCVTMLRIGFP